MSEHQPQFKVRDVSPEALACFGLHVVCLALGGLACTEGLDTAAAKQKGALILFCREYLFFYLCPCCLICL